MEGRKSSAVDTGTVVVARDRREHVPPMLVARLGDRLLVIGDADCPPSRIQTEKNGNYAAAVRVAIFRRVMDEAHAQRLTRLWSRVPCCCYCRC